jgi:hypothetical protein
MQSDVILYMFHNYFRIVKFARYKYHLSVNCIIVLSGCYVYSKVFRNNFTRTNILKFCRYFDNVRINKYTIVLLKRGYLIESGKYKQHPLYKITKEGITVIEELKDNYSIVMNEFISKYNIIL